MLGISAREKQVLLYSVRLCCIYIGDGGRTRFPTVRPVFEIVLELYI